MLIQFLLCVKNTWSEYK